MSLGVPSVSVVQPPLKQNLEDWTLSQQPILWFHGKYILAEIPKIKKICSPLSPFTKVQFQMSGGHLRWLDLYVSGVLGQHVW